MPRPRDAQHVAYDGRILQRTEKAVLFYVEDLDEELWFPLSICDLAEDDSSILVPRWLARNKGLD